ncbi:MAG TPA: hypothetical protein DCR37_01410 [Glaciecola sp.]|nr:hypothetical protein [Glaciecola sp.]
MFLREKHKMPLRIRSGEVFSSWLIRLAMHYGVTTLTLGAYFWPKRRIWTMDVDSMGITLDLAKISDMTGNSEASICRSFPAHCYDGVGTLDDVKQHLTHWFLRLGTRNVKRHSGIPYCPRCFCSHEYIYIKQLWRMAWHTHCEDHYCLLRQGCPKCGALYAPHRLPLGTLNIGYCHQCASPLGESTYDEKNESAYTLQALCISTIASNEGPFNLLTVTAHAWLEQLYFITNLTKYAISRDNGFFKLMLPFMNYTDVTKALDDGLPFTQSNNSYRAHIMQHVYDVWQTHGPEMVTACIDNGVSMNTINPDNVVLPEAISTAFKDLQMKEYALPWNAKKLNGVVERPSTDASVRKKWRRLQRKYLGRQ